MLLGYETCDLRQGHAVGRVLLRRLYEQYTGAPMPQILETERGKPYFADSPVRFSISHTKDRVFCVLSHKNVGMDAERMDRKIDLRLAQKILSPGEMERWQKQEDKHSALLRLWVLKEAYAKLTGLGLQGYPNHTEFDPDDPRVRMIENCYVAILE